MNQNGKESSVFPCSSIPHKDSYPQGGYHVQPDSLMLLSLPSASIVHPGSEEPQKQPKPNPALPTLIDDVNLQLEAAIKLPRVCSSTDAPESGTACDSDHRVSYLMSAGIRQPGDAEVLNAEGWNQQWKTLCWIDRNHPPSNPPSSSPLTHDRELGFVQQASKGLAGLPTNHCDVDPDGCSLPDLTTPLSPDPSKAAAAEADNIPHLDQGDALYQLKPLNDLVELDDSCGDLKTNICEQALIAITASIKDITPGINTRADRSSPPGDVHEEEALTAKSTSDEVSISSQESKLKNFSPLAHEVAARIKVLFHAEDKSVHRVKALRCRESPRADFLSPRL
ncbi:hypothetical protein Nepgr_019597 [Nepenthes gracilis]|uniref:Uncharacterized protein n=1 Tax=Nepenthes gracilis TaxID=150966 RepID=A0AAD3SVK7_NEPGR|nr:hypothetical protein Nepgr_019597 [Nepenthes gracilis]